MRSALTKSTKGTALSRKGAYSKFQKAQKKLSRRLSRTTKQICPSKSTLRRADVRHTTTGKHRKVRDTCITKRGHSMNPMLGVKIGPLRKGELTQFGYEKVKTLSQKKRRKALKLAVAKYGSLSVWKKINVLYVYNKYMNPKLSELYNDDKKWIKNTYGLKATDK